MSEDNFSVTLRRDGHTQDGAAQIAREVGQYSRASLRARVFPVPWYIQSIPANNTDILARPWAGAVRKQGIVAPFDLTLLAYSWNMFGGVKASGTLEVVLTIDGNDSEYELLTFPAGQDNGSLRIDPEVDVISAGSVWALHYDSTAFGPAATIDLEVFAWLTRSG